MLSEIGQMGCEIFFVLSGFGLCYSWQKTNGNFFQRYGKFLRARWVKIGLPYYFTMILLIGYICVMSAAGADSVMVQPMDGFGVCSLFFLINGMVPKYHNYLFPGAWYMGTLAILYMIFPFVYSVFSKSSRCMLRVCVWVSAGMPVLFSLLDYYCLGVGKHLINSFWYFSAFNQFPCFFIGILLYFEFGTGADKRKYRWVECIGKTLFWLLVFSFFFWLRESLLLSAAVVSTAFGMAVYWLFLFCSNYLQVIYKKWKLLEHLSVLLGKYGEVSYYAFLIHGFFVRDFLHWLKRCLGIDGDFAYGAGLVLVVVLVYWSAKGWRKIVGKILVFFKKTVVFSS